MAKTFGIILGIAGGLFVLMFVAAILAAPLGAAVMLLLGVAHSYNPAIPPLGFIETWVLVFALRVATVNTQARGE